MNLLRTSVASQQESLTLLDKYRPMHLDQVLLSIIFLSRLEHAGITRRCSEWHGGEETGYSQQSDGLFRIYKARWALSGLA